MITKLTLLRDFSLSFTKAFDKRAKPKAIFIKEIRDKGVIDFSPKNIESYSAMQKTRELVAICQIVK